MADQSPSASIAGILSQQLFDQYSTAWVELINQPSEELQLLGCFTHADSAGIHLITGLGFSTEKITQLVSTIGAVRIKARFILLPALNQPGGQQFSLALFATDSLDTRVSSYYVPEVTYTDTATFIAPTRPGQLAVHKNQVHYVLAERWRQNWAARQSQTDSSESLHDLFETHYGPLRGYTYELSEFIVLFQLLKALNDGSMLRISFVLHDYYQPDPTTSGDELTNTFALVLQIQRSGLKADGCYDDYMDGDDPITNNGMPCPPMC